MTKFRMTFCALLACALLTSTSVAVQVPDSLKAGKADLKSAGAMAFGPNGVLFVGDSMGGMIYALDTQDRTASQATAVEVTGMTGKIAAMLGTAADQIQVNDVAVNPVSRKTYVSVSRGLGPDSAAVIVRVDPTGNLESLALDNIRHSSIALPNPVNPSTGGRGGNHRVPAGDAASFSARHTAAERAGGRRAPRHCCLAPPRDASKPRAQTQHGFRRSQRRDHGEGR